MSNSFYSFIEQLRSNQVAAAASKEETVMRKFYRQNLTLEEVKEILVKAHKSGAEAAAAKLEQMRHDDTRGGFLLGPCGGSYIKILLDGRSRLAKQLKTASKQIDTFSYNASYEARTKNLSFSLKNGRQELEVYEACSEAALVVLTKELNVVGYVYSYYT